jgi:nicotinate phosphoribosyltransferase
VLWPGVKQVFRELSANGYLLRDRLVLDGEEAPGRPLLELVMRDGRRVCAPKEPGKIREYTAAQLRTLPERLRSLAPAEALALDVSERVRSLLKTVA